MIDLDMDLKRAFDERLAGFVPPARRERHPVSRSSRLLVGTALATMVFGAASLAMDVQAVAAANGTDCADVFAKIKIWTASKLDSELTPLEKKAVISKIARESGCVGEKVVDPSIPKGANPKAPDQALPPKSPWGD